MLPQQGFAVVPLKLPCSLDDSNLDSYVQDNELYLSVGVYFHGNHRNNLTGYHKQPVSGLRVMHISGVLNWDIKFYLAWI